MFTSGSRSSKRVPKVSKTFRIIFNFPESSERVRKGSKMAQNDLKCLEMVQNDLKCLEMLQNVLKFYIFDIKSLRLYWEREVA